MDPFTLLGIGLQIVSGVLANIKQSPTVTLTEEQLEDAEAGLALLQKFHGSPVTKAQLESLRG